MIQGGNFGQDGRLAGISVKMIVFRGVLQAATHVARHISAHALGWVLS